MVSSFCCVIAVVVVNPVGRLGKGAGPGIDIPPGMVLGGGMPTVTPVGGGRVVVAPKDEGGGRDMLSGGRPGMLARLTGGNTSETEKDKQIKCKNKMAI